MSAFLQQLLAATRRNPLMVTCVTLIVLLGVANYFLWQRQAALSLHHDRVRQDGEATLAALAGHNRIIAQLTTVQEALAIIDKNLVVEAELADNLSYFYQMETVSRARLGLLNQLSSQPPPEGVPYKPVPFSLRVSGTYFQVMSFLRELENGPRLLRIKNYNFSRADATTNTLAMDLTVELLGHP
ncbi:MAG TPA: type 4a pilus biogenesis protein PilO [Lacunisphaera sp.]|nr:type 4a pilus biogenesis protein PilO [Lacunisphaera sp.]